MKIAVIGSRGMVGSAVMKWWNSPAIRGKMTDGALAGLPDDELFPMDLPEFDVSSRLFTKDAFDAIRPDVILNVSGINLLDWLESHPNTARTIHVQGAANLREAAKKTGALLVQLGCAEVFYSPAPAQTAEGEKNGQDEKKIEENRAKTEEDVPNPESVYALTKLDAERAASEAERHLIVRTSTLFGAPGSQGSGNLVETVLKASRRSRSIQVIREIVTSPTFKLDLLRGLYYLIQTGATGRYHVAGPKSASLDEMARFLLDACGLKRHSVTGISMKDYGCRAPRSTWTVLDSTRYRTLPGAYPIPDWKAGIEEFLELRRKIGG